MTHLHSADGWMVETVPLSDAVDLVKRYHYSRSAANTATARHGLFDPSGELVGAALWIPPTKNAALTVADDWQGVLCLTRLVIAPEVPTNGASFLLGRSMRLVDRSKWHTLLTYADSTRGHDGAIYRATNWDYLGETPAGDTWTGPDGEQRGRKRGPKTLTVGEMVALGFRRNPKGVKHKFVHRPT